MPGVGRWFPAPEPLTNPCHLTWPVPDIIHAALSHSPGRCHQGQSPLLLFSTAVCSQLPLPVPFPLMFHPMLSADALAMAVTMQLILQLQDMPTYTPKHTMAELPLLLLLYCWLCH